MDQIGQKSPTYPYRESLFKKLLFLSTLLPHHNTTMFKKSQTCEESGAHLRISLLHLLINLKNKLLLKKTVIKNKITLIFTMLHFLKKHKGKDL